VTQRWEWIPLDSVFVGKVVQGDERHNLPTTLCLWMKVAYPRGDEPQLVLVNFSNEPTTWRTGVMRGINFEALVFEDFAPVTRMEMVATA
jgi:hypothetical protein